jgi:3-dehydroquinate synthase
MVCAARLSERVCGFDAAQTARLANLIAAAKLPIAPPRMPTSRWVELMLHDKKVERGALRFVLLEALGHAVIRSDVPEESIAACVEG